MSASTQAQPKSILKKTQTPLPETTTKIPTPKTDAEKRRLATVLQHARLIQEQKDIMAKNLNSIEELSDDFPTSSTPTEAEIKRFLALVMDFQPSDYEALIEERHVNGLCGYGLCANAPRATDIKRPWLRAKGSENWCSNDCAKRGLYVKAQLNETPAWERWGGSSPAIVLYDESKLAASKEKSVSEEERKRKEQRELALERGEGKVASFKIDSTTTEILEKTPTGTAKAPEAPSAESEGHNLIEGYLPKGVVQKGGVRFDDDEEDDDEDTDLIPFCPPKYFD